MFFQPNQYCYRYSHTPTATLLLVEAVGSKFGLPATRTFFFPLTILTLESLYARQLYWLGTLARPSPKKKKYFFNFSCPRHCCTKYAVGCILELCTFLDWILSPSLLSPKNFPVGQQVSAHHLPPSFSSCPTNNALLTSDAEVL